jgi:hypothetical protein
MTHEGWKEAQEALEQQREEQRQQLENSVRVVQRLWALPEWQVVEQILKLSIDGLRDKNEAFIPAEERAFLLGQLYTLRWFRRLPDSMKEKVELTRALDRKPTEEEPEDAER